MEIFHGAAASHEVMSVFLTTGEAGISGTAAPRRRTSGRRKQNARAILGFKAVFLGEIDGATGVAQARYLKMA